MNQNMNDGGTPKTLEEAIVIALCIGPIAGIQERMHAGMRDYLSQKFQVALMKCHTPEQLAIVEDLWFAITGERLRK